MRPYFARKGPPPAHFFTTHARWVKVFDMNSKRSSVIYMKVKSAKQGTFLGDDARAGHGKTTCLDFRFSCEVPHDVRKEKGGEYAVVAHKPVTLISEWNPMVVQCLSAAWTNEVLDEVSLDFVRFDAGGQEVIFATMTLYKATVAIVDLGSGDTSRFLQGDYTGLAQIGLSPEKIEFKVKDKGGDASAHYDRKMATS